MLLPAVGVCFERAVNASIVYGLRRQPIVSNLTYHNLYSDERRELVQRRPHEHYHNDEYEQSQLGNESGKVELTFIDLANFVTCEQILLCS